MLIFLLAFFLDFFELAFIIVPLLAPVAEKLGIDLIWFGVLLGVNMQTSFMHPPFGFALFYLRSVAPAKEYIDRVTGKRIAPVTTGQIYWGAVPFVLHPDHHGRAGDRLPAAWSPVVWRRRQRSTRRGAVEDFAAPARRPSGSTGDALSPTSARRSKAPTTPGRRAAEIPAKAAEASAASCAVAPASASGRAAHRMSTSMKLS